MPKTTATDPDLFGRRNFRALVKSVRQERGRVSHDDLVTAVRRTITLDEYDDWASRSFRSAVIAAAKTRASRDAANAVYGVGDEVAPLSLFSVEEFEAKAHQCAVLHIANRDQVYRLRDLCESVHGVTFDAEAVLAAAAA